MKNHVAKGERIFIVPGLTVREPIPWGRAQVDVIEAARKYMLSQIAPVNHCGECRQCCKTLHISEDNFFKHSHEWCQHADKDVGCLIHWKRPKPCQAFACLWLKSQKTGVPMSPELRPDKTHVVLTSDTSAAIGEPVDPDLIEVHVDRDDPEAAERDPIASFLTSKKTKRITFYYGEGSSCDRVGGESSCDPLNAAQMGPVIQIGGRGGQGPGQPGEDGRVLVITPSSK